MDETKFFIVICILAIMIVIANFFFNDSNVD